MLRYLALLAMGLALPMLLVTTPAAALTTKQKMETCKIGANAEKLTGAKRNTFIKRCMARGNYEPPSRRALKKHTMKKKPAKKKPAMKKPEMEKPTTTKPTMKKSAMKKPAAKKTTKLN